MLATLKLIPWKQVAIGLGAALILYACYSWAYNRGAHSRDNEIASLQQSIANLKAASAQAQADNNAHVLEVEQRNEQIRKEQTDALTKQRDDAMAAADSFIKLHTISKANPGNASGNQIPQPANTTGSPNTKANPSVMVSPSDVHACTEAYVTAQGWQDWWDKVSESPPR
jgi:hypothetical protein